jgi:uncharacterized protein YndB with AHSA1/START domain
LPARLELFFVLTFADVSPAKHQTLEQNLLFQTNLIMETLPFIRNRIVINAPLPKVWDALVNPEQTKKYMFGCETVSNWEVGSPLLWKGNYEGKEMIFVKGTIVDIHPERFLAYTTFDPTSTMDDIAENYLTVTYDLSLEHGHTVLVVTQGDYTKVANGDRRYEEAYNNGEGWDPILLEIKKILEA